MEYRKGDILIVTKSNACQTGLQRGDKVSFWRYHKTGCVIKVEESDSEMAWRGNRSRMRIEETSDILWNFNTRFLERPPVSKEDHIKNLKEKYNVDID